MRIILHFIRQLCLPSDKIILGTFACIMIDNRPVGAVLIVVQYWIYEKRIVFCYKRCCKMDNVFKLHL